MSKLIVMVGIPGSGKSYRAGIYAKYNDVKILSSDTYRKQLFGDENDQTHNEAVFQALYKDACKFITEGKDVIIDATNTTLKARKRIFAELKKVLPLCTEIIAWVVATKVEICVHRDKDRDRTVGMNIINKFIGSFQFPQKFEGFTSIWIDEYREGVLPVFNYDFFTGMVSYMEDYDQNNPHHIDTLGVHCRKVAENYSIRSPEYAAGMLHDIGKIMTQSFDDKSVAHYYNHDNYGAYMVASSLNIIPVTNDTTWDDIFEILFYINYHMRAHNNLCGAKAEKKYRTLFGDDRFDRLMQFGEYDRIASGTYKGKEE